MFRFIYVIFANLFRGPYMIPHMRKLAKNKTKYSFEVRYRYVKRMINYMMKSGNIKTEIYGKENLPEEGGYVMFPNHQGKFDALAVINGHDKPCTFVMDKAKSKTFLVNEMCNLIDAKRLDLDDIRQNFKIINEITEEVKEGKRFILFSEGGYSKNHNKVKNFKPGSFKSAMSAHAPLVPVCLIDSYIPFNSLKFGPCVTKVIFMEPLFYEEYKDLKTPEVAKIVRERIIAKMAEFGVEGEE